MFNQTVDSCVAIVMLNQMVEYSAQLDLVFQALSDPTRRAMLEMLKRGERSVSDLAAPFEMSLAGAAKHVKVLETASLINRRKSGRTYYCSLNGQTFAEAKSWLDSYAAYWNQRLDALEKEIRNDRNRKKKS